MTDALDYARAARLSYEHARRYVETRGWARVPSRRNDIAVFRFGDHEAVLPIDTSLTDYASAMVLFARRVGEAELRAADRVLADMEAADMDRHRPARLAGSAGPGVSLDAAEAMLDGMSRALLASACSVIQPREFHPRMTLASAEAFIAASRFVHTEVGSFVMVIDTPTEVEDSQPAFGRNASLLLLRSVAHLAASLRSGAADRIPNPLPGEPQVSANLCEAILRMAPPSESSDLKFSVSWSPVIAPPLDAPQAVTIDRHMYEAIEQVARQMRPSQSTAKARYFGLVKELKGGPGSSGRAEGEVTLTLMREDESTFRAKAQLDADQYAVALQAHAASSYLIVTGELHQARRGFELRKISEVSR